MIKNTSALLAILVLLIAVFSSVSLANDFYVGETGQDTLGFGNNQDTPFRSITFALFVADTSAGRPHNIYIDEGNYNDGYETFPLPMTDQTHLIGTDPNLTVINAFDALSNVVFANFTEDWSIENLTLTNGTALEGGAISIYQGSGAVVRNLIIRNNRADFPVFPNTQGSGGGLMIYESENVIIDHVLFEENSAYDHGGAISIVRCSPILSHLTIVKNLADEDEFSGAIYFVGTNLHTLNLENSIIWGNPSISFPGLSIVHSPNINLNINYNLIENENLQPWPGNFNYCLDPLFSNESRSDYTVLTGSPTVDTGNPESPFEVEPEPNGGIVNCGYFGNTPTARFSGALKELRRNEWALIGLPVDPESNNAQELFGDDLDNLTPGDDSWRLQRFDNDSHMLLRYAEVEAGGTEFGDPPAVEPGIGYLIRQSISNRRSLHVPGWALSQEENVGIPLSAGDGLVYQTIANPFPYNINTTDLNLFANGNHSMDEAAAAGFANRWIYILGQGQQFIPTLGSISPWEGAVLITHGDPQMELMIPSERNNSDPGNQNLNTTWALRAGVTAYDSEGEAVSSSNGHMFGIGESMENGYDPYDALNIDWIPATLSFEWKGPDHPPLFHSFLNDSETGDWRVWYADIWVNEDTLRVSPDSAEFYIDGIINEDGEEPFPPLEYNFWLTAADYPDYTEIIPDLRDTAVVRLPFEEVDGVGKRLQLMIWCSREGWDEVSVEEPASQVPDRFGISSAYPNPFNSTTNISFTIHQAAKVDLTVYDVLGRQVDKITSANYLAGTHRLSWNADLMASGIYFVRMESAGIYDLKKIVLVR